MSMLFNHGTSAYYLDCIRDYIKVTENTLKMVKGLLPSEVTLACTRCDQFVGQIGISCVGTCLEMYSEDCASYYDPRTKKRYPSPRFAQYRCDESEWRASTAEHTEAFVKDVKAVGLWMKDYFFGAYIRAYVSYYGSSIYKWPTRSQLYKWYDMYPVAKNAIEWSEDTFVAYNAVINNSDVPFYVVTLSDDEDTPYAASKIVCLKK